MMVGERCRVDVHSSPQAGPSSWISHVPQVQSSEWHGEALHERGRVCGYGASRQHQGRTTGSIG